MHILLLAFIIHIVKPGETLWGMAGNHWPQVCAINHIRDCNLIYPGETVKIPKQYNRDPLPAVVEKEPDGDGDDFSTDTTSATRIPSGHLSCYGLERLWEEAHGRPGAAFIAAEIAMAESGGNQYATGPEGERGYWQIYPAWGSLSTYDAYGNARAAIIISHDGYDWSPWTTFTEGLYYGRCL